MAGVPTFRKSQGIVPFGVGAIVDFPEDSLMAAGLDMWPQVSANMPRASRERISEATRILDARLQRRLTAMLGRHINQFYSPAIAPDPASAYAAVADATKAYMPFVRFPKWHFCPRCRTLWNVPWNTSRRDERLRCNSEKRLKKGDAATCSKLKTWQKPRLIPVRFAVACPLGHIMDFPWQEWAHKHFDNCGAGSGKLFLVSTGAAGLAGLQVICSECGARNTLTSAFRKGAFSWIWPDGCPGERPWLGPSAALDCQEAPITIQRGASNAYFAKVTNSILIPPYSTLLRQVLDRPDVWSLIKALPLVDGNLPREPLAVIAGQHGLNPDSFIQAVEEKLAGGMDGNGEAVSEEAYRSTEYRAFLGPRPPRAERHDFDLLPKEIGQYSGDFGRYFENIVMIPRLRETRALIGFSRVVPPGAANSIGELSLRPRNWLPAMEVRGEGVFLVFRRAALANWLAANPVADERAATINARLRRVAAERKTDARQISPVFLLVHTFAHLLIRQLTFDCGYDSSSLRERIYVGGDCMAALLIYTASGDSEGTLGGLVRQGLPGRLERTFRAAVGNARLCSSDPLCVESEGQGINGLSLAACHACTLLPETSCEEGNRLLDRALVVGTQEHPGLGFLSEVRI